MTAISEFQSKVLSRRNSPDEYRIYRAGLEWDLTDPIVIQGPEDFKSKQFWHDRLEPYQHQVTNLITFCRRLPVTLLADDVGLGKTISAGLIVSELISRARLSKILIVCPKLLLPQWKEELSTKFDISAEIAIGKDLLDADPEEVGAVITTYNSARLYLERLPRDRFQMLILDEAHKLRNLYGVEKTPQVAKCFQTALRDRRFQFVLMLTATPIQNRLWDLYSLVDLLATARGHENPLGSEGMFIRNFIADKRDQARQLKPEAREEFRSIIYSYMSRMRRGDANLYFPDRIVQMHAVDPTAAELDLIRALSGPIQKLNKLSQISILQALTSSPDALRAQLINMAQKGTVPKELAAEVNSIVNAMPLSAKLHGLGVLIDKLKKQNPDRWRLVIFTGRRETQTTIQAFLEKMGFKVGLINGDSGQRNQETIERFRQNPPVHRIIVSTEAGSEGVNLQVANVLVNYDLPWNPMIVEQRIGRVQRLASEHAHVSIFNIMLRGTFEEYIVGRLMEKLQMASHAIGDIEALLQASDIGHNENEEGDLTSFEDKILQLVLAALAEKDVEAATKLTEMSIEKAKTQLESEEANINSLLGRMDGTEYVGPRAPNLPSNVHSMELKDFALAGLQTLGVKVASQAEDLYLTEENGGREYIRFREDAAENIRSTLYAPSSSAFQRLVGRIISTGIHEVEDLDQEPIRIAEELARQWVESIGSELQSVKVEEVWRSFGGSALLRVRATVTHDSYERLVEAECSHAENRRSSGQQALVPLTKIIENPVTLGLNTEQLVIKANADEGISEFSRFYLERREQETRAANNDERKRKKLHDEFTPRLGITLVGLKGKLYREIKLRVHYIFDNAYRYESSLSIVPHSGEIIDKPTLEMCSQSKALVPTSCLSECEMSGKKVLRHLLVKSEISGRRALSEFIVTCSLSKKKILKDETETSSITGNLVAISLLHTSSMSGKRAEPEHFAVCDFTKTELLKSELAISEISGKRYRIDEQTRSIFSSKTGHQSEFISCHQTQQMIAKSEAEKCELTNQYVRPGILERCSISGKNVMPTELDHCSTTNQKALKEYFVTSSITQSKIIKSAAIQSAAGNFCLPTEAVKCFWSDRLSHPDDLRTCSLTGLTVYHKYATSDLSPRLQSLSDLLDGVRRNMEEQSMWENITSRMAVALKNKKCRVETAIMSPAKKHMAVCTEVKTYLGIRVTYAGGIYDFEDKNILGRIAEGKRNANVWQKLN